MLSACESGLGDELDSEGLIGLVRAFQFAGARTVAATLWQVDDEATAELMARFYRYLRARKPKDEALRSAQLELIREPVEMRDQQGPTGKEWTMSNDKLTTREEIRTIVSELDRLDDQLAKLASPQSLNLFPPRRTTQLSTWPLSGSQVRSTQQVEILA